MVHSRYGGSGLGLFICRSECARVSAVRSDPAEMAELLGGRIEVVSKPGAGSGKSRRITAPYHRVTLVLIHVQSSASSSKARPRLNRAFLLRWNDRNPSPRCPSTPTC
jgi:signal transduction histidine kinase